MVSSGNTMGAALTQRIAKSFLSLARTASATAVLCCAGTGALANDDVWKVTATPYMWLQGTTGDLKVRGVEVHVDNSFRDVLKGTDTAIGGFLNLAARSGEWGFYLEGNYSYTSTSSETGRGRDLQVRTHLAVIEAGGLYKLAGSPSQTAANGREWRIEALAGVRYVSLNVDLEIGRASADRTNDWFDPFVGVAGHVYFAENWALIGHADVGGFGIGSSFTTNLYALIGYRSEIFGANVVSSLGYRGLYIDRHDSSKSNSANVWLHGPVLGMSFRF